MKFYLVTGFRSSVSSFQNDEDYPHNRQGVLHGGSSAASSYIMTSEVSLSAYQSLCSGTSFIHPISGDIISDYAVQYAHDKT
jgi:hypothetical protein